MRHRLAQRHVTARAIRYGWHLLPRPGIALQRARLMFWNKLTHLGDTSLMAPAAILICLWLLLAQRRRLLLWWGVLLTSAAILVSLTKIAFIGWGIGSEALDFTGISGHTTFATLMWPTIAFLLLQRAPRWLCALGVLGGLWLGLLVGVSRVTLGMHSPVEAVSGWLLGAGTSLSFISIAASTHLIALRRWLMACSFLVLTGAGFLHSAPTQYWLIQVALYLSGHERPFERGDWQKTPSEICCNNTVAQSTGFRQTEIHGCVIHRTVC